MDVELDPKLPAKRFRGRSEHTLDEKGRLNIPSRFQEILRDIGDDRFMLIPWGKFIKAYTVPEWELFENRVLTGLQDKPDSRKLIAHIGGVVECLLKQGRILLSPQLRKEGKIDKEVVLIGKIKLFEIWDRETWERENKPSQEDFLKWSDDLAEYGLL